MSEDTIITVNGRRYDASTGLPVADAPHAAQSPTNARPKAAKSRPHRAFADIAGPVKQRPTVLASKADIEKAAPRQSAEVSAISVHQQPQRSQTLNRIALHKPTPQLSQPIPVQVEADPLPDTQPEPPHVEANSQPANERVPVASNQRSPLITKFAPIQPEPVVPPQPAVEAEPDRPARVHPLVAQVNAARSPVVRPQSSSELKEALIRERLDNATPAAATQKHRRSLQPRLATILTSSLALLLLAGYLTYINLPNISMRVAAARAGIAATYPNYQPDGYHFAGPITFQPGQVNITFRSNTNGDNFVIKQKASGWDNQAVLDNYAAQQSNNYLTYQAHGLTIYAYGDHAAWVNGGLLYTIDGNAPLGGDQLLSIATSM